MHSIPVGQQFFPVPGWCKVAGEYVEDVVRRHQCEVVTVAPTREDGANDLDRHEVRGILGEPKNVVGAVVALLDWLAGEGSGAEEREESLKQQREFALETLGMDKETFVKAWYKWEEAKAKAE